MPTRSTARCSPAGCRKMTETSFSTALQPQMPGHRTLPCMYIKKQAYLRCGLAFIFFDWKKRFFSTTFLENWRKVVIFAATITVSTMGCERHKLHIYRTGNVESLHFETSQMECGRLIREDQPAFFIYTVLLYNNDVLGVASIKKRDKVKMDWRHWASIGLFTCG